ncbi:tripartite motif-containing protein 14-like [Discoglossus pictus]
MAMDPYNTYDLIQPNHSIQESDEIFCTYCVHSQVPAAKSCLLCEASLCDIHVNVHSKSEQHVLTEPTTSWVNRKCPIHKEVLKYYCTEDAVSVCVSCSLAGAHRGHQVELLNEASEKKKSKLRNILEKITSEREEIEKRVQSLQQQRCKVEDKATGLKEQVTSLLMEVMNEITRQEEQILLPVSDLIQQMEKEKEELSREMSRIEKLCNMTDPLIIMQDQELHNTHFCDPDKRIIEGTMTYDNNFTTGDDFDENLISEIFQKSLDDIVKTLKIRQMSYVQKASCLLIDVNTAGNNVSVSQDFKTISRSEINQQRPKNPERFLGYPQALSITSFSSGRHYWEVDTSEHGKWRVGMAYRSMERQGRRSSIGVNNKSWCLRSSDKNLSVLHDSIKTQLPHKSSIQRFGVFLDYEAGRLSFYELCDPIRLLHTFTATFTEPLHAAFWRPKNPERFLGYPQALSITIFASGCHYWKVDTSEHGKWRVGMAHRSMERQGRRSSICVNNKSWCLRSSDKNLLVLHDSVKTQLPHKSSIQRFGVFLDYEAGRLSFYELCYPIRHLHTFTATFNEPLHAAFWVFCNKSWVTVTVHYSAKEI